GIDFVVNAPSAGDYRLFLDFQHQGVVRTAEFTLRVTGTSQEAKDTVAPAPAPADHGAPGHGH
ncbi:hypothetical protein AB0I19_18190, partial [Nocardia sp. NPDC050413]